MQGQKESKKKQKDRINKIIGILSKQYPGAKIALVYKNPFELLVATVLSAQCTDERVNLVTKTLFKKYKSPDDYLKVPQEELEQDIYSTGFYKAKAKNIRGSARMVIDRYQGKVPDTMEELLKLPGVGRKTANVILGHAFDTPGLVVDTHVTRLANRLGFANTKDAVKIEFHLMDIVPETDWVMLTHYFISHGRAVCKARKAECSKCVISELCPSAYMA